MPAQVLLVEERLRLVVAYLDCMKQIAGLVDEPVDVPWFETPKDLAKWVQNMADVMAAQVSAVRAALPAACGDLEAPFVGGAR